MLFIVIGARGAGKSTLLEKLASSGHAEVLQASTTRPKRDENDDEYHFLERWNSSNFGWEIDVGEHKYGVRKTELAKGDTGHAVTVFDPLSIDVLEQYREVASAEIFTIGLDTISDFSLQSERVDGKESRVMTEDAFETAKTVTQGADLVLSGNPDQVYRGVLAAIDLLSGRGGTVTKFHLEPMMKAGGLLKGAAVETELKSASYDLRVGTQIWCQGKLLELDDKTPTFTIPPYSYAIVSAQEEAWFPTFLSGRFDIKVSLFLRGVILSNGPQVDPGYRGPLFCMLFNGSSDPRTIARSTHFSTIEFTTVTRTTSAYKDKYHLKSRLETIMTEGGLSGQGGNIIEDMSKKYTSTNSRLDNAVYWLLGTAIAIFLAVGALIIPPSLAVQDQVNKAEDVLEEVRRLLDDTRTQSSTNSQNLEVQLQDALRQIEAARDAAIQNPP